MAGSHQLAWPENSEQVLGLTLVLIDRLAADSRYAIDIGLQYFYSGNNSVVAGVRSLTRQIIIPFVRDYKTYVLSHRNAAPRLIMQTSNKVFIVHGHDGEAKAEVARFIEKLGFTPVILHELASKGRTIIEKVESNSDVSFAVVLLTPDDEGNEKGKPPEPRARQNVVLELGYFVGRLGRDRVCALRRGDVEIPSDFDGVVYETYDDHGAWKSKLAKELEAARFIVDWAKVHA